jgi:hypothetical protein
VLTASGEIADFLQPSEPNWQQPVDYSRGSGVWYAKLDSDDAGSVHEWTYIFGETPGLTGQLMVFRPVVPGIVTLYELSGAIEPGDPSVPRTAGSTDELMIFAGTHAWARAGT